MSERHSTNQDEWWPLTPPAEFIAEIERAEARTAPRDERPRLRLLRAGDLPDFVNWLADGLADGLTKREAVKLARAQLEVRLVRRFERIAQEGGR